jgi:hypothetical protein
LIHGGDPGPSDDRAVAANIVAALAPVLAGEAAEPLTVGALQERFQRIGAEISVEVVEPPQAGERTQALQWRGPGWHYVQICYGVPPHRQCVLIQLPSTHAAQQ